MDAILDIVLKVAGILSTLGFTTILGFYLNRKNRRDEDMRKARCEETRLILQGILSIGKLSYATALAVQQKKINGEMDDAMDEYKGYTPRLTDYLMNQAVEKTH